MPHVAVILGLFDLGGGEIILMLALLLILVGAKKLPDLAKGMRDGLFEFRNAIDEESTEAGRSLGGIYGKPAAQVITIDNQVAELYEPAIFEDKPNPRKRRKHLVKAFQNVWRRLLRLLRFTS